MQRASAVAAAAVVAAVLAGCSADISRLDSPSYTLNDPPRPSEPIGRRNAGAPMEQGSNGSWPNSGPRAPAAGMARTAPAPLPPASSGRMAGLPEAGPGATAPSGAPPVGPSLPFDAPKAKSEPRVAAVGQPVVAGGKPAIVPAAIAAGETIDVLPGDTLYAIAKRHGVSIAALMQVNGLKSANLKPGQKLVLPLAPGAKRPLAKAAVVAPAVLAPAPATTAANWDGSHTVKPGDSLYGIARAHKITSAELQRVNGITEVTRLRPGAVLKVPGPAAPGGNTQLASTAPAAPGLAAPAETPRVVQSAPAAGGNVTPKILNAPAEAKAEQLASVPPTAPAGAPDRSPESSRKAPSKQAAASPATAGGPKFRWPVSGKTIAEFGKRPDGTHNDGINIAVAAGTDVVAADGGTVAYAGSELKGYGNLVLIRHDNGWVSAYAHSDQLLVKRGDAVKRGQAIAKAGKSGTVDQPQVHFELRQGSKPVDPLPHMEKN